MDYQLIFKAVKNASKQIQLLDETTINRVLKQLASETKHAAEFIIGENSKDLARMEKTNPKYDRLLLSKSRIEDICSDLIKVSTLPSPLGKILENRILQNGLDLTKVSVPLGAVGIIYEARPNVTFDCMALCFKSGNAVLLKGGSDAEYSNKAIISVIHKVLEANGLDKNMVYLLPTSKEATLALLHAVGWVDMIIPRGSQTLIDYVRENAKVPVIETGAGIVHAYFDESGNIDIGVAVINNSKTRRVSVCNALDCLIIHKDRLNDLPQLTYPLVKSNVHLYADMPSYASLQNSYPSHLLSHATHEHYGTEFLDYKMAIKTVENIQQALEHIDLHSSRHSELIISQRQDNIDMFFKSVDAAAVYCNASTAFTDGAQFGMGAEIGISTQKLHARGPMALQELTSYKWLVKGAGQIRS